MKILKNAERLANSLFEEYWQGRHIHFAFIFKRNRLINYGVNEPNLKSPKILYLANRFNVDKYKEFCYPHAETAAIMKCWGKTYISRHHKMVVLRLNRKKEMLDSMPCSGCKFVLDNLNINKVWYSTKNGFSRFFS